MATTQMPIDGVFDTSTGKMTGVAGLSGPEIPLDVAAIQALVTGASKSRTGAILGDSIASQNLTGTPFVVGTSISYGSTSWLAHMQAQLGWPWEIQYTDNFAVGGTSSAVMRNTQLPLLLDAHKTRKYNRVFISSGTNDLWGGRTLDEVKADLFATFQELSNVAIIPVYIGILPRFATGGLTASHKRALAVNSWASELARDGVLGLEFIDEVYASVADLTSANGYGITAALDAQVLHPNDLGAQLIGDCGYRYYKDKGFPALCILPRPALIFLTP